MFTVEDGTGLADATGYIETSYLEEYAAHIGYDLSSLTEPQKQSMISRVSMNYIDIKYDFKGDPLNEDQGLSLPTSDVSINDKIKRAVADACIIDAKGELFNAVDTNGRIKSTKDKLDVLETEVEYQENKTPPKEYGNTPVTDKLLKPYLSASGGIFARWPQ